MTQSDFGTINPTTKSGTQLAEDLNNFRDAVNTKHSGASRPSYVQAGTEWLDTSAAPIWTVKLYDGSEDIVLYQIDTTNNISTPKQSRQEVIKTADYTLAPDDAYVTIIMNKASAGVVALPALSGTNSELYFVKNIAANAVTIDPNASETIDGATTLTLATNESAWIWPASGKGSWRVAKIAREIQTTVDVASASTTNVYAAGSQNVRITGTTGINGFDVAPEGTLIFGVFAGTLTLTHNVTSFILPGGANIVTNANDRFTARSLGSNNWVVLFYQPAEPVINTKNGQYKFPSPQNPSSNVNTLDDYEEGTTSPVPAPSSGAFTTASASLAYTKIGRVVTFSLEVTITNAGTGSGTLLIQLPKEVAASFGCGGMNIVNGQACNGHCPSGDSILRVGRYDGATAIATGAILRMSGVYQF